MQVTFLLKNENENENAEHISIVVQLTYLHMIYLTQGHTSAT